jgi:hypothetical protein
MTQTIDERDVMYFSFNECDGRGLNKSLVFLPKKKVTV